MNHFVQVHLSVFILLLFITSSFVSPFMVRQHVTTSTSHRIEIRKHQHKLYQQHLNTLNTLHKRRFKTFLRVSTSKMNNQNVATPLFERENKNKGTEEQQRQERIHFIKSPFLTPNQNEEYQLAQVSYENVMIILNSPIEVFPQPTTTKLSSSLSYNINPIFDKLWNISSYKVCADGGANRLYDVTYKKVLSNDNTNNNNEKSNHQEYIPDLIKGDLDSVHENIQEYYKSKGCMIIQDFDQDTNDLDKALEAIREWWIAKKNVEKQSHNSNFIMNNDQNEIRKEGIQIYIYGAFGGRFDQEMASIQALYKWSSSVFDYRIFLYNHETCSWLLKPMKLQNNGDDDEAENVTIRNDIQIPFFGDSDHEVVKNGAVIGEGPTCGLIPIACRSDSVKTTGLKWNLDGSSSSTLEFGGLVSSSNRVMDSVVTVYTSAPLIFTAEIVHRK